MNSTCHLTSCIEAWDDTAGLFIHTLSLGADCQAAHCVVNYRSDLCNVKLLVHLKGCVVVVNLAEAIFFAFCCIYVVPIKTGLQLLCGNPKLCSYLCSIFELLHYPPRFVVVAVPLHLTGSLLIQDQAVRGLVVAP